MGMSLGMFQYFWQEVEWVGLGKETNEVNGEEGFQLAKLKLSWGGEVGTSEGVVVECYSIFIQSKE